MSQYPDFDSMNETDVRETIVRPLIESLGYGCDAETRILTEKTLRYDRSFLGHKKPKKDPPLTGRADYICEVISFGRWVVEVKSPSEELTQDVVEQAHTYAMHPEIAASFFLITNGRKFRLYETAKLERSALEWNFEDEDKDETLLRLSNVLSPSAFRERSKIALIDPGKPLGKGLASRLRIVGGQITNDEYSGNHPLVPLESVNGLSLPVTGGYVTRAEDKRIVGYVLVGKAVAFIPNSAIGLPDCYDFFSATDYLSGDPDRPTIFQNIVKGIVPAGSSFPYPGIQRVVMPFEMTYTHITEAVGYVRENTFVGMTRVTSDFNFSNISPEFRNRVFRQLGQIPDTAHITGTGRFEILLQTDI
ncbi:MAG: type I restriction enzyme HsdR N-terminal domain-containing protein [Terracidiphilus sp.]